ncbi:MAG: hypothetical protein ACRENZ_02295 [Thermodesulfobacteriota bacterium]
MNKYKYGLLLLEKDLIAYLDFTSKDKPLSCIKIINEIRDILGIKERYGRR